MSKIKAFAVIILLVQTGTIAYYSADFIGSKLTSPNTMNYADVSRDQVNVVSIHKSSFIGNVLTYGRIKSAYNSVINTPVFHEFKLTTDKVFFKTGEKVIKDDLLVLFKCPGLEYKLEASKKEYEQQKAVLERMNKAKTFVSKTEFVKAQLQLEKLEAQYNAIAESCEALRVRAPFDGIVSIADLVEGEVISKERIITSIVNNEVLEVEFYIDASMIENIKLGSSIIVETTDNEHAITASVTDVNPYIDEYISKIKIKAKIVTNESNENIFKHNLNVNVILEKNPVDDVFVVPRSSLIEEGSNNYVCKVERRSGVYETRLIKIALIDTKGDKCAIQSNILHDGDYVIFEGFIKRDGVAVIIKEVID